MLTSSRDNWERLVAAVVKKQQIWELCHQQSRTPSIRSTTTSTSDDDDLSQQFPSFSGANFVHFSVPPSPLHPSTDPSSSQGRLVDGTLVAVKGLKVVLNYRAESQFMTEVHLFSVMAVHQNLLRLCGFCTTSMERLVVYPYMANGSVASCLRERLENVPPLDLGTRKRIALGIARGLSLILHGQCVLKIIHRDQEKNVFAYGVTLLKLISTQRAFELFHLSNDDDLMLFDWVKGLVDQLIQIALLCTQSSPSRRPNMSEVVSLLEGDGLAKKWDEWQKMKEVELAPYPTSEWIITNSIENLDAVELSGPR